MLAEGAEKTNKRFSLCAARALLCFFNFILSNARNAGRGGKRESPLPLLTKEIRAFK